MGKGVNSRWSSLLRSTHWKHIVNKYGAYCEIVGNSLTHDEALILEAKLISSIGRIVDGGTLVNITTGGEGMSGYRHSEESKSKIGTAHRGKAVSAQTRMKMKASAFLRVRSEDNLAQLAKARETLVRKVVCCETGIIYASAKEAARMINGDHSCIIKVCLGKRKKHLNLTWKYYGS